jgi:hypothetical protein
MNAETPDTAVAVPPVTPLTTEPKPITVTAPKSAKVAKQAKSPKAKANKVKAAGKGKKAKAPAKAKAKKPAKQVKAKSAKTLKAKPAKVVKAGKFPRHPKNPFREGSAYGQIFDAFVLHGKSGIRRDELLQLAMDATGKDVKHAAYDLAVIRSAKESNNGPRHPSCAEGFWVKRDNDCFTLMVD